MNKTAVFCAIALFCCSCGTIKYIPIETTRTEYRNITNTENVFLRDSIFVKEKGDTLILEKYRYLYRDRILRDSVIVRDTIRVPYPVEVVREIKKPLSSWQNFQVWCGRIALVILLFVGIYFLLRLKR